MYLERGRKRSRDHNITWLSVIDINLFTREGTETFCWRNDPEISIDINLSTSRGDGNKNSHIHPTNQTKI